MVYGFQNPVELHLTTKSKTNDIIFQECNESFSDSSMIVFDEKNLKQKFKCELVDLGFCKVLVPPIEILYVVTKSHIHRILNVTANQEQNDEVWYSHVKKYKMLRDKLGYEKLDSILYSGYLLDWKPLSNDESLEDLMRKIYQLRFEETTKRVGDTPISMNKSEKDFFNDNVKRYVDHDKLHEAVAMEFRGVPTPIFFDLSKRYYISKPGSGNIFEICYYGKNRYDARRNCSFIFGKKINSRINDVER